MRKNKKPELVQTVTPILGHLKMWGFSCDVIESKAVFSRAANRYLRGQAVRGMPDIVGCDPDGIACYIEAKAPGKRSTLKPHQRAFLLNKIDHGAFAVCVDSAEQLFKFYSHWQELGSGRKDFLRAALPASRCK